MPTLAITTNYSAWSVLTQAHLDDAFGSITTFMNTTKIDSDNIQSGGVSKANLVAAVQNALCPVGSIVAFMGTSAPTGWLLCSGQAVSRTTYSELYSVLDNGGRCGTGDGVTTFNVPDCRGFFLRGAGPTSVTPDSLDNSTDTVVVNAGHGYYRSGMRVQVANPCDNLSADTTYYIAVVNTTHFGFCTTHANAVASTPTLIEIDNLGTMYVVPWDSPHAQNASFCLAHNTGANSTGNSPGAIMYHRTALATDAHLVSNSTDVNHTHEFDHTHEITDPTHSHQAAVYENDSVSSQPYFDMAEAAGNTDTATTTSNATGITINNVADATTGTGGGSHQHLLNSGGDKETTPNFMHVNYIIKAQNVSS